MLGLELNQHVVEYLSGDCSLDDFEDWFVPATWNVHAERNQDVCRVANHITALLVHYNDAEIDERQLRSDLSKLMVIIRLPEMIQFGQQLAQQADISTSSTVRTIASERVAA